MARRRTKQAQRSAAAFVDDPKPRLEVPLVDRPPLPRPWLASGIRLAAGSHPIDPNAAFTALVADHPRRGSLVLADAMELATWARVAIEQAQTLICQNAGCGFEGCEAGSWVTARLVDGVVELGVAAARDPRNEWAFSEYRPPKWLAESGPCRIPADAWDRLADEARALARLPRAGRLRPVLLPTVDEIRERRPVRVGAA